MDVMDEARILSEAIDCYGKDNQQLKAIEEMAELTKAILKLIFAKPTGAERDIIQDAVSEEMADVDIMLDQLKMIYNNYDKIEEYREKKLERLKRRMKDASNSV